MPADLSAAIQQQTVSVEAVPEVKIHIVI